MIIVLDITSLTLIYTARGQLPETHLQIPNSAPPQSCAQSNKMQVKTVQNEPRPGQVVSQQRGHGTGERGQYLCSSTRVYRAVVSGEVRDGSGCCRVSRQAGAEVLVSVLNLQSNKAGPLTPRQKRPAVRCQSGTSASRGTHDRMIRIMSARGHVGEGTLPVQRDLPYM